MSLVTHWKYVRAGRWWAIGSETARQLSDEGVTGCDRLNRGGLTGYVRPMRHRGLRLGLALGAMCIVTHVTSAQPVTGVVRPGDRVALLVRDTVDTVPVTALGRVVLPLVGPLPIAGLPIRVAEDSILRAMARVLTRPDLRVEILRRIVVDGAVRRSTILYLDETVGMAAAIALAGGLSDDADARGIELWRDGALVGRFDERTAVNRAPPLDSGDRILVARSPWVSRNAFLVASLASNLVSLVIFFVSR